MDLINAALGFFAMIGLVVFFEASRREPCRHINTRCLHGDAINLFSKTYVLRWWKPDVIRRQICISCGAALDRLAICTATGEDLHEWEGPWPYEWKEN